MAVIITTRRGRYWMHYSSQWEGEHTAPIGGMVSIAMCGQRSLSEGFSACSGEGVSSTSTLHRLWTVEGVFQARVESIGRKILSELRMLMTCVSVRAAQCSVIAPIRPCFSYVPTSRSSVTQPQPIQSE